ncbi:transposase [Polaribacter litorisediminis]|nr:transposase [Polaribacter litorisediminis]
MAKKRDNEFKVMLVELLKSGSKPKELGEEYGLNPGMISRWKREFAARSGDFSKKKVLSAEAQELKALKKEFRVLNPFRNGIKIKRNF